MWARALHILQLLTFLHEKPGGELRSCIFALSLPPFEVIFSLGPQLHSFFAALHSGENSNGAVEEEKKKKASYTVWNAIYRVNAGNL